MQTWIQTPCLHFRCDDHFHMKWTKSYLIECSVVMCNGRNGNVCFTAYFEFRLYHSQKSFFLTLADILTFSLPLAHFLHFYEVFWEYWPSNRPTPFRRSAFPGKSWIHHCNFSQRHSKHCDNLTEIFLTWWIFQIMLYWTLFSGKAINAAGIIGSDIIEVALSIDDIKRYYQMLQKRQINEDQFVEEVLKQLLIRLISVAGTELGRILGFSVAGPVGLFLGGILGNIFGKLVGRAIGNAVVFYKDVVCELLRRYYGCHLYNIAGASPDVVRCLRSERGIVHIHLTPVLKKISHFWPAAREGNVFTCICDSVHNRPHGYSVTAHPCWLLSHSLLPRGQYASYWNAFLLFGFHHIPEKYFSDEDRLICTKVKPGGFTHNDVCCHYYIKPESGNQFLEVTGWLLFGLTIVGLGIFAFKRT